MGEKITYEQAYQQLIEELGATNTALRNLMAAHEKLQKDFDEHRHIVTGEGYTSNPGVHIAPYRGWKNRGIQRTLK